MNKWTINICALLLLTAAARSLNAGEFSPSASFARTQSRAAAVGAVDAAYYNPAGLAGLKDGFYLDFGYQLMVKTATYEIAGMNGEDKEPSWFIPQFAAAYKHGKGALFLSLCMPEGIERVDYSRPKGGMPLVSYFSLGLDPVQMATLANAGLTVPLGSVELPLVTWVKGSRYWLQGRLGGSFALHEMVAVTGGVACSYFEGERSAGILDWGSIDRIEKSAVGWSGFFGLMLGSPDRVAFTVLYSTMVIGRGTEKNAKYNYSRLMERRLPDYLLVGLSYLTSDKTLLLLSYRLDFSGERNYGSRNILTTDHEFGFLDWLMIARSSSSWATFPLIAGGNAQNYKHRNRHSFGIGVEVPVKGMVASLGLSYATQEKYPRAQNALDPDLQRVGLGGGVRFNASDSIAIDLGTAYYFYLTDRMLYNSARMDRGAWTLGASVTIKAM
jgi:hypothetical protein